MEGGWEGSIVGGISGRMAGRMLGWIEWWMNGWRDTRKDDWMAEWMKWKWEEWQEGAICVWVNGIGQRAGCTGRGMDVDGFRSRSMARDVLHDWVDEWTDKSSYEWTHMWKHGGVRALDGWANAVVHRWMEAAWVGEWIKKGGWDQQGDQIHWWVQNGAWLCWADGGSWIPVRWHMPMQTNVLITYNNCKHSWQTFLVNNRVHIWPLKQLAFCLQ